MIQRRCEYWQFGSCSLTADGKKMMSCLRCTSAEHTGSLRADIGKASRTKASCYGQVVHQSSEKLRRRKSRMRLRLNQRGQQWAYTLTCCAAMTQTKTQAADVTAGRLQTFTAQQLICKTKWVKRRTTPPWAHRANAAKLVYTWSPPVRVEPQQRAHIIKSCYSVMHWPRTDAHTC